MHMVRFNHVYSCDFGEYKLPQDAVGPVRALAAVGQLSWLWQIIPALREWRLKRLQGFNYCAEATRRQAEAYLRDQLEMAKRAYSAGGKHEFDTFEKWLLSK